MKKTLLFIATLLLFACNEQNDQSQKKTSASSKVRVPTFEILPPIGKYAPQVEVFSIDNSKDTVLISDHGAFINVPANCLVNENGEPATNVEIEFTEYANPADILLSGIPMEYVTEDGNETFQSAGMCEIDAKAGGEKVSIAKDKSIDVGLKNRAQDPDYNLYYFDKQKGEWLEKEKNLAVDTSVIPVKPLTLSTIDTSRILHIDIEDYSFNSEFEMWDQSNFYVLPGQDPKYHDQDVFWYHMEVVETTNPELFILKFNGTKGPEQVVEALKVQPLVTPENKVEAMRQFNMKMREHAERLLVDNAEREKLNAEATIDRIEQDQVEMTEQMRVEAEETRIQNEKIRIADSIRRADFAAAPKVRENVMRTFQVNQLGLYNCDRFYQREILSTKKISLEHDGKPLEFNYTYLCSPRDNAVLNNLKEAKGAYHLDLSSGTFYFVGVKGEDIFCKEITTQTSNGTHEIEQVEKEVFENLMM